MIHRFKQDTWLEEESVAYPNGAQTRKGAAIYPDGKIRRVYAGIPDTWFSIPAHGRLSGRYVRGWLSVDDSFIKCPNVSGEYGHHADGGLHCELCQFGLIESPTHGALIFHIDRDHLLKPFAVVTANGERTWQAETAEHAREQHEDAFGGEDGEAIIRIYEQTGGES